MDQKEPKLTKIFLFERYIIKKKKKSNFDAAFVIDCNKFFR